MGIVADMEPGIHFIAEASQRDGLFIGFATVPSLRWLCLFQPDQVPLSPEMFGVNICIAAHTIAPSARNSINLAEHLRFVF